MTTQTICILGGTGFVGRHLAARLAKDGHRLKVLTRHRERHRDLLVLPRLILAEADAHDAKVLAAELDGCDAAVNLIGILNERGRDGRGFYQAHVELPRKLAQACRETGVRRVLHMSALNADAAYGRSHYLRTKGEGENIMHAAHDLRVTSFRPSIIFGVGDSFFNRFARLLKVTPYWFPLAAAGARLQPVHVGDVVEAFARVLAREGTVGKRLELCGPKVYSLEELVEYTAATLGLRRSVLALGDGMSRLQARLLEHLPGKPFSWDNYLTLQQDSVCHTGFPEELDITPAAVEDIVPGYLTR
ncbi:MAG: complex I NDUFA9 subunit family protein [Gammaproteobacteria bacterium]|nr:complex I NDUFA9 subunit family protein [Gammaproteobacteria bacterium]